MDLFRAGPAWVRRGTQGHVAAPTWRSIHIIFLFNLYIKRLQPSLYGKGY